MKPSFHLLKSISKRFVLFAISILFFISAQSQKQDVDVQLLSEIISKKQDELKQRLISNLVIKNVHTTNRVTYSTLYYSLNTITTEKNKTVMSKDLFLRITDYAITYGLELYFFNNYLKIEGENNAFTKSEKDGLKLNNLLGEAYAGKSKVALAEGMYKSKSQTKDTRLLKLAAIHNFLFDALYDSLSTSKFLTDKGLYDQLTKQPLMSPRDLDYGEVLDDNLKLSIANQIQSFKNDLETARLQTESIIGFINRLKNIKSIKDISKEDIELLFNIIDNSLNSEHWSAPKNQIPKTIFSVVQKYLILDLSDNQLKAEPYPFIVDVEAIILTLFEKYEKSMSYKILNTGIEVKPFFTIGLNQGSFINQKDSFQLGEQTKVLKNLTFASEKIGVKFVLWDFEYTHSFDPGETFLYRNSFRTWEKPVNKMPFISNINLSIYGGGFLYNLVDLKTEKNFNYGICGAGLGIKFYNDLDLNVSYAFPVITKMKIGEMNKMGFINLGFDIPIFEYLNAK